VALVADFNVRATKHFKIPDDWTPTSRCALFVIAPRLYWTLPCLQSMETTITDVSMQRFIYYRSQALLDAPLFTVEGRKTKVSVGKVRPGWLLVKTTRLGELAIAPFAMRLHPPY